MLRYSDELQYASAHELFYFKPALDGAEPGATPENMRLILRSADGAPVLDSADCIWNADDGCLELTLDLSASGLALEKGAYSAEISFDCDGAYYAFESGFDVVPHPWRPNLSLSDVQALVPGAAYAESDHGVMATLAVEAEEQLRLRIRASGLTPGLIANRAALDQCLRSLLLSLACQRASRDGARDGLWNKHLSWQATYEAKWRELAASMRYDGDADGAAGRAGHDMAAIRLRP